MNDITDRKPSELSHEELREEWEYATARIYEESLGADEHDRLFQRHLDLWRELESRVDVEYPRCPECGFREGWAQSPGEPKECTDCCYVLGDDDQDVIDAVDDAWRTVVNGGEADE